MAEIQLVRLVLVLSMIWNVCSWTVIPEGDFEMKQAAVIDGLHYQMLEDIKSEDWRKSVELMKRHLDHSTQAYKQLNNITDYKDFPLSVARYGYTELLQVMLHNGLPINTHYFDEYTMLHRAVQYGQYDVVQLLIQHGADVNVRDWHGDTPLHDAAIKGNLNIVQLLLESGADINATNNDDDTPLTSGRESVLQWFVDNGYDKTIPNKYGNTAGNIAGTEEMKEKLKEK